MAPAAHWSIMQIDVGSFLPREDVMQRIRRRRFLSNVVGGAGALQALGAPSLLAAGKPPSEQINVAVIGINGMGGYHLRGLLQRDDVRVSALCDVDERVLAKRSKEVEKSLTSTEGKAKKRKATVHGRTRRRYLSHPLHFTHTSRRRRTQARPPTDPRRTLLAQEACPCRRSRR
jgi:hypothetical protein